MISVLNGGPIRAVSEAVFFPFDRFNVPLMGALRVKLRSGARQEDVVCRGDKNAVDHFQLNYYGTVIKIGDKLHMWYLGGGGGEEHRTHGAPCWYMTNICYATSSDGVNWEKPNLGLVEHNGSRSNNLVDLDVGDYVQGSVVLHDPADPDPKRRFKMVYEPQNYGSKMAVAYSPDGLRWRESPNNPVVPYMMEMSGLIRIGECYYVNGQTLAGDMLARVQCTHVSYDFEHWTTAYNVGHRRDDIPGRLPPIGENAGHQVHLGAGLADRGNTILGFYGIWNAPDNDRRHVYMDLGLLVTADALTYHEPVRDFPIVEANCEERDYPSLMQGQGCENVGDRTLVWFGRWRDGGVHLAWWERDRLGFAGVIDPSHVGLPHLLTCPFRAAEAPAAVWVNVDGLSADNRISVAMTDERFRPLEGFDAPDCRPVTSGLRSRVTWKGGDSLPSVSGLVRLKISFEGLRSGDIKLFAAYVGELERG